jgi:hypothetical protein
MYAFHNMALPGIRAMGHLSILKPSERTEYVKFIANLFILPFFRENSYLEFVPVTPSRIVNRHTPTRLGI